MTEALQKRGKGIWGTQEEDNGRWQGERRSRDGAGGQVQIRWPCRLSSLVTRSDPTHPCSVNYSVDSGDSLLSRKPEHRGLERWRDSGNYKPPGVVGGGGWGSEERPHIRGDAGLGWVPEGRHQQKMQENQPGGPPLPEITDTPKRGLLCRLSGSHHPTCSFTACSHQTRAPPRSLWAPSFPSLVILPHQNHLLPSQTLLAGRQLL